MHLTKTTRAVLLSAVVAAAAALPTAGVAEGHSGDFEGNKGFVGDKGFVGHVPHQHRHRYLRMVKKRTYAEAVAATQCPHAFYGMYLGTMYCQDGKVLK